MEVSTTEIAQRKLTPGSLRSISWTLFFPIVLNPELSDNRRHMKAVWSVLGVRQISLLSSQLSVRGPGQSSTAR